MTRPLFTIGGVPEHFNLPWHLALSQDLGLAVEPRWRDEPSGTGAMCRALEAGVLDLAVLLTEGMVKHVAGGGKARLVGTYTDTPLVWGIHVCAEGPIKRVSDLAGARYAISRHGSGSHLMAELDAAQRGWPKPELVIVGDLAGGRAALAEGRADAFMWEKTMSLPQVHAGEWRRVGEFAGPWPAFVIAASDKAMSRGLDWLPRLLSEVGEACVRAESDREATVRFIGDSYGIPNEDILAWLDQTKWGCRASVSKTMLDEVVSILGEAGILGEVLAAEALVAAPSVLDQ